MPRGFVWCVYETDVGQLFSLRVDADSAADPNRGWLTSFVEETVPVPRGWRPRYVLGIDTTGHTQTTRIGRIDAALWTGVANQWVVEATDGNLLTVTRIGRVGERARPHP